MGLHARCIELHVAGRSQKQIVEALGVSQSTVSRWLKSWREQGQASLAWPKMGGSKGRMTPEQDAELAMLLSQGAVAHGFEGEFWTHRRVAALIERHFGVSYKDRNIAKVLKRIGYSRQRPQARDYRQDAAKVAQWREERLPDIKKKPNRKATRSVT